VARIANKVNTYVPLFMSVHIYEIQMFTTLPVSSGHPLVSNCITEAFLLHARVLCDFFQKSRYKDDVICSDYGFEQRSLEIEQDIEARFDKCLAHLTYSRACFTDDTRKWLLHHFQPALLLRIKEFLANITSKCALPLLLQELAEAKTILGKLENS
jgi:hypothetical protein